MQTDSEGRRLLPRVDPAGPRVSVVMPTFRRSRHLGATIRSLLEGRWTDFELLVRDDGDGIDGTYEAVVEASRGDERVLYCRNREQLRMPGNLNAGILHSRGDLIAVCHDHDLYAPDYLQELVRLLDRHPTALYAHSAIEAIDEQGRRLPTPAGEWPEFTSGMDWLAVMLASLHCPVCALTLVRREAHERHGLYDPAHGFVSDVEMWMRLAIHGDVAYSRRPLIQVRQRESGHPAGSQVIPLTLMIGRIHRHYIRRASGYLPPCLQRARTEWQIARAIGREVLVRLFRRLVPRGRNHD